MDSTVMNDGPKEAQLPLALTYRLTNNFREWPTWNYPSLYEVYCTNNYTIPGERNYVMGSIYIAEYLFYLALYLPSLIVISRPPFIELSCYKLMLAVGVLDNAVGSIATFGAGVLSLMGANYCDNTMLLIVVGHALHGVWFCYCMSGVLLAFNRYIELKSGQLAYRLFSGKRLWLWFIPPVLYGTILSSSVDLPPIYNSQWSVYYFQIDMSEEGLPVNDWVCFFNSMWVMSALIIFYSLLLYEFKKNASEAAQAMGHGKRVQTRSEKMLQLQAFLICFFLFLVAASYAAAGFIHIPLPLTKLATIAIQMCSGFTSIVYLACNSKIRRGVRKLLCGAKSSETVAVVLPTLPHPNRTQSTRNPSMKERPLGGSLEVTIAGKGGSTPSIARNFTYAKGCSGFKL